MFSSLSISLAAFTFVPDKLWYSTVVPATTRPRARGTEMGDAPKKIVVTGVGVVSALGSKDEFWESLVSGKSGLAKITSFDASVFPTTIGAECSDFDAKPWFANAKTVKSVDRFVASSKPERCNQVLPFCSAFFSGTRIWQLLHQRWRLTTAR